MHFITAAELETQLLMTSLLGGPSSTSGGVATVVANDAGECEASASISAAAAGEKEASRERLPMINYRRCGRQIFPTQQMVEVLPAPGLALG